MSINADDVKDQSGRRQFIGLAGSLLGVAGTSALWSSSSAKAAEDFPAELYESLVAYATKVGEDKGDLTAIREELDQLVEGLKNGHDLVKLCRILIDGRPELAQTIKPYQDFDDDKCWIIIIIIIIIIILSATPAY